MMTLDAIVVGAGQAGLAAGYELARRGRRFLILDAGTRVGDVWRARWDSLRLFTPARYSGLPGLPFPAAPYHLPSREEMADYLERYAAHFALPVRLGARVTSVRPAGGGFVVRAGEDTLATSNVVVATGAAQRPQVPEFAGELESDILQLHSSAYRNPAQLPAGDVLVVGAGNSGAQIALELASTRRVWLAGRDTGRLPRRLLGRDVYDWLWPTLMRVPVESRLARRLQARMRGGDPLVGIAPDELLQAGIRRVGRVAGVRDGLPLLEDGSALPVRAVVWCTGYRQAYPWLELPVVGPDDRPRHRRGVTEVPGLYFLGLRFQTSPRSSLIGGVGHDAREIVEHLVGRQLRTRTEVRLETPMPTRMEESCSSSGRASSSSS